MTFRYRITDPAGAVHTAETAEAFDALLDRLQAESPDAELELDADVTTGDTPRTSARTETSPKPDQTVAPTAGAAHEVQPPA
jgi:hypothetical protein